MYYINVIEYESFNMLSSKHLTKKINLYNDKGFFKSYKEIKKEITRDFKRFYIDFKNSYTPIIISSYYDNLRDVYYKIKKTV